MRSSLLTDRIVSVVVIAIAIVIVEYGWSRFPRPAEAGPLILGMAAALAVVRFYRSPAGRPLLGSTLAVVAIVLAVQAGLQLAAWRGWI